MISFRLSSILLAVFVLGSALFTSVAYADNDQTRSDLAEPEITITIDRTSDVVDTSPGSDGEVKFTITVVVYLPSGVTDGTVVVVDLKTRAWWWDVSEITEVTFTRYQRKHTFPLTVIAPTNSTADRVVDLEIWGSWEYQNTTQWGSIEKISLAQITVIPFYDLFIGSNNPVRYADVGDWTEFTFNITNRANTDVNVTLTLDIDSSHIIFEFGNDTVFLKKGQTKVITFRVKQEPSRSRGNTIHVYAKVNEDPSTERWDLPILFFTEPTFGTFFYEGNFIRLVVIIGVIIGVAVGLFIWEKRKKEEEIEEEEVSPRRRPPRSMSFSKK